MLSWVLNFNTKIVHRVKRFVGSWHFLNDNVIGKFNERN